MVKSASEARKKWEERIKISGKYYKEGVKNPDKDWLEGYLNKADQRDAGLRRAIDEGRLDIGAKRVGTVGWQTPTLDKGVSHWTEEAPKAGDEYEGAMHDVVDCVAVAKAAIEEMDMTTRESRAEASKQYQIAMGECMDKKKGY